MARLQLALAREHDRHGNKKERDILVSDSEGRQQWKDTEVDGKEIGFL